jgi:hypothetical protein
MDRPGSWLFPLAWFGGVAVNGGVNGRQLGDIRRVLSLTEHA